MEAGTDTAASTLRTARRRSGLSQKELGARAGVTQSVISSYESGQRQPSLPTLVKLVDATGCQLTINVTQPADNLCGPVGQRVRRYRRELIATAAEHGVTNLRVFGSVARNQDRLDSDVDLLVDLPITLGLFGLGRAQAALEKLLGTHVDLVPAHDLKPAAKALIERELVPL
jgi:uncharacterized protein